MSKTNKLFYYNRNHGNTSFVVKGIKPNICRTGEMKLTGSQLVNYLGWCIDNNAIPWVQVYTMNGKKMNVQMHGENVSVNYPLYIIPNLCNSMVCNVYFGEDPCSVGAAGK